MTSIPDITLNNGQTIPQFGFGVFQIEPKDTVAAVGTALEAGYRPSTPPRCTATRPR